jgi:hypothetical protein
MLLKQKTDGLVQRTESEIPNIVYSVHGDCYGVCIHKSSPESLELLTTILVEDDGLWYERDNDSICAYWISDLSDVISRAKNWIEKNSSEEMEEPLEGESYLISNSSGRFFTFDEGNSDDSVLGVFTLERSEAIEFASERNANYFINLFDKLEVDMGKPYKIVESYSLV